MGKIKQVRHTYKVIGNMNEFQVALGETTFGGRDSLQPPNGIIDYGSMMYIALQRSKTAKQAIKVMTRNGKSIWLCKRGESISVSDPMKPGYLRS